MGGSGSVNHRNCCGQTPELNLPEFWDYEETDGTHMRAVMWWLGECFEGFVGG
jgi:hypothetical protein